MSENHKKMIFHIHTSFSSDSRISPKQLIEFCKNEKIDIIVVCDHNTIDGAKAVSELADDSIMVIMGEEIKSMQGEIIGLFLNDNIRPKMTLEETIFQIKKQNGLVCLPHPGESLRRSAISKKNSEMAIKDADIVEVYNSRTAFKADMDWAYNLAEKYDKPIIYGSDSHNVSELHGAICQLPDFVDASSFIKSLEGIKLLSSRKTGFLLQALSVAVKYCRRINKLDN